jgi:hypothetical protein
MDKFFDVSKRDASASIGETVFTILKEVLWKGIPIRIRV